MNIFLNNENIKSRVDYFSDGVTYDHDAEYFMQYLYCLFIRPGDTVIDVGANRGLHTLPMAHLVGHTGKVYAFEAIPGNADNLSKMLLNFNVEIIQAAATNYETSERHKLIKFCHVTKLDGFSGIIKRPNVIDDWEPIEIEVPSTTLDHSIPRGCNVSFIKSDVECGDFHVLQGAERILKDCRPIIIFESGRQYAADIYGYTKFEFFDYFKKLDYDLFTFTGERFDETTWVNPVNFWETWAVPKESTFNYFFQENLAKLAMFYTDRGRQLKTFYSK